MFFLRKHLQSRFCKNILKPVSFTSVFLVFFFLTLSYTLLCDALLPTAVNQCKRMKELARMCRINHTCASSYTFMRHKQHGNHLEKKHRSLVIRVVKLHTLPFRRVQTPTHSKTVRKLHPPPQHEPQTQTYSFESLRKVCF